MKFSVIVPIYNVEKSLSRCFDSILAQTYMDFEIIAVNDGSPDNSQAIIDEYSAKYPEYVKGFKKENGGLSDARNYGVSNSSGEYLVFVDSDDYIADDMLERLAAEIDKNAPDVIGINCHLVYDDGTIYGKMTKPICENLGGDFATKELVLWKECYEPACFYAYKRSYWQDKQFAFMKGIYHEDYALTPLVILLAERVTLLDYFGYYYVSNQEGITKNLNAEKQRKMASDMLKGYDYLLYGYNNHYKGDKYCGKLYLHYISSSLIYKLNTLPEGEIKETFRSELKKRKIIKHVMHDNVKRKIRQLLLKVQNKL